jgi:hypothetical protein
VRVTVVGAGAIGATIGACLARSDVIGAERTIGGLDGKSSPRLDAAATLPSGWGPVEVTDNIWRDLAVRKRRTEVDEPIAAAAAIGSGHGLPMTLTTRLVEMIHELEEGSRDRSVVNVDELDALRAASGEPHD